MLNQTRYDKLNALSPSEPLGKDLNKTKNVLVAIYDFAVQGGATGTVKLLDEKGEKAILPDNAIVKHVLVEAISAFLSAGSATLAFGANTTTDLLGATAKASLGAGAFVDGVPANTAATVVKTTAERQITATIGTAAATAGKVRCHIEYDLSE